MSLALQSLPQVSLPYNGIIIYWKGDPKKGLQPEIEVKSYKFSCEAGREFGHYNRHPGVAKVVYVGEEGEKNPTPPPVESEVSTPLKPLPIPVRVP